MRTITVLIALLLAGLAHAASGKVYGFVSEKIGTETAGGDGCTHVELTLSGALEAVGPVFHHWFERDGELIQFDGPIRTYTAE